MSHVNAAWIQRFARRLMELQPSSTPLDAVRFASSAFQEQSEVGPDKAAEAFVLKTTTAQSIDTRPEG
jgi:hypothetical protein